MLTKTGAIKKISGDAVALSPAGPLVAECGVVDSPTRVNSYTRTPASDYFLYVTDYEKGVRLGQTPIPHGAHTLAFSPDGRQILVLPGGKGHWKQLLVFEEPWNAGPVAEDETLHSVFHGCWLDSKTVLVAGTAAYEVLCIALWNVEGGNLKVLHQEGPLKGTQFGDATLNSAFCSPSGMVAFTVGYGRKVVWYRLKADRRGVSKGRSFTAKHDGNGIDVAISEDGERLLCTSTAYGKEYATLFTPKGEVLDSVEGVSPHERAYRGDCVLLRGHKDSTIHAYQLREGKLVPWCNLEAESGEGIDVKVEEGRTLVAIEQEDHTAIHVLKDIDQVGLFSEEAPRREAAARVLGQRRYQPAAEDLAKLVEDSSDGVRAAAVEALGAIGDARSLPALLRGLGQARTETDRDRLIGALGQFGKDPLTEAAVQGLGKAGAQRRGAILLLKAMPDLEASDALCGALTDVDVVVRSTAAQALGKRRNMRALVPLLARLNEEQEAVQAAVREALFEILEANGYLTPELRTRVSGRLDLAAFAEEMIKAQRWRGLPGAAADLVSALAGAAVGSGRPLPEMLNSLEALADAPIALAVALGLAEVWLQKSNWGAAEALFRKSVELAKGADAAGIEWRAWQAAGECAERSADDRRALEAFREGMTVIDRMWFALLEEDKLRTFFQDKAELYERASLCALRLGYAAMALEIHEKAKTRYLGDLIARRHMDPRVTLDREWKEFWSAVDGARPVRLPLSAQGPGGTGAVEIVGVERGTGVGEGPGLYPARLAAMEDSPAHKDRPMLRHIWSLVFWVAGMEDDRDEGKIRAALEKIYQALEPLWMALETGTLPLGEEETARCVHDYEEGAFALLEVYRGRPEVALWAFREYGTGWIEEIAHGAGSGPRAVVLGAVREALNLVLRHEPVLGVPREGAGGGGAVFVARTLSAGPRRVQAQTAVVESALERQLASRWRYASHLARGDTTSHQEIAASLDAGQSVVQLEFQVTEEGTIVYLTEAARSGGRMPALRGGVGPEVFTFNRVSLPALRKRLVEGDGGWVPSYRARHERGGLDAWKESMNATLEWLDAELLGPVEEELRRRKATDLRIVPHRALQIVPWAGVGELGRRLVDRYAIECAPSATLQQLSRTRRSWKGPVESLTAVADPGGDLPFAAFEVEQAAGRLAAANVRILRGSEALVGELERTPAGAIFHFAGHGSYDWTDPLGSCLRFAGGGRLRLSELFDEKAAFGETRLVILSACETNLVDAGDVADECLGMASGFLFAGAAAVLSTLWAVSDVSTALLIDRFYSNFLERKLGAARALQEAQTWLRDQVTRPLVIEKMDALLGRLDEERRGRARWSEENDRLEERALRIRRRRESLALEEQEDRGGKPFAHPYYWSAFTLSGGGQA